MFMKSPVHLLLLNTGSKTRQKTSYREAASAIQKKLEEIKKESKMPAAVNNKHSLFRYRD